MFVNNVLNLFAISQFSVISFRPSLKKVGNCFLGGDLDIISFMVFHVFLILVLFLLKVDSQYIYFAARIVFLVWY